MLDVIEYSRSEPYLVDCPASSRANENSSLKFSLTGNEQLGFISSANTPAYRSGARQESRVNQLAYDLLASTQMTEQEQSVARPMDKPAVRRMEGQSLEVEQVPQQMTRPIILGIDHAFLVRHSQDRALSLSPQLGAMGQSVEDEAMEQDVADTLLQLVCSAANVTELSPYAMESLDSAHNSSHTLVLSVERRRARLQEREETERAARWWCSCERGEVSNPYFDSLKVCP